MFNYKRWLFIVGFCLLFSLISACSSDRSTTREEISLSNERNGVSMDQTPRKFHSDQKKDSVSQKQKNAVKNAEKQGRKITYKATVSIDVDNYQTLRSNLEGLVQKSQGYLVDSSEHQSRKNKYIGTFTYRIPQNNFETFINGLKNISPDGSNINIKGNDVTEEMVDLNARLKAKKATEARLLQLMNKATESSTLLAISEQLDSTQVEIEQIQGRLQYLKHRVDFSEVTVTLTQDVGVSAPDNASMVQKMKKTFIASSIGMINIGKNLLIFLAGAIPVLIALSIIFVPIYLLIHNRRRAKKQKRPKNE